MPNGHLQSWRFERRSTGSDAGIAARTSPRAAVVYQSGLTIRWSPGIYDS
jgi:hypothetical protein